MASSLTEITSNGHTNPGMLVRLRPSGPWRIGVASGARDQVDSIFHSDTLYAAITHAMRMLGRLEYWLEITARRSASGEGGPLVRFSSMYPFFGDTLYITPPKHIWPPAPSVRVPYSSARFIPLTLVDSILGGKPLEDDRWAVDGITECLVPVGKTGPFRVAIRSSAAVDRISGASEHFKTACLEFLPKSGMWFAISFADRITRDQWVDPLKIALRLLADSGFGGERSRGWGRAHKPEFREGALPQLVYKGPAATDSVHWTLSLMTPAETDRIAFDRGSYSTTVRGGRIDSPAGVGAAKKLLTMIEEGSVLHATTLEGSSPDVAPEGFEHPVYHAGWALTIRVPAEVSKLEVSTQVDAVEALPVAEAETLVENEELSAEVAPPDAITEALEESAHLEQPVDDDFPLSSSEDIAFRPQEIATPDEELEQLENQDPGGPNDDVTPPMSDPGPMEPPFSEPEDISPIDGPRDPDGDEPPPGPNPDEPDHEGPQE